MVDRDPNVPSTPAPAAPGIAITPGQIIAFARNIASAISGVSSILLLLHFLTQDQINTIVSAVQNIGDAVSVIFAAILTIIPIVSALFAGRAAGPVNQAQSLIDGGHVDKILASPDLAAASKSDKVIPTLMYEPKV